LADTIILKKVKEIRVEMPRLGTRKLHDELAVTMQEHNIKMGRDRLFDLLEQYGMLVRRRRRRKVCTTDSNHPYRKYPNLVREMQTTGPNQLWVSDITYIRLTDDFSYLSLITDAYSRKIVGYCLYRTLHKEGPVAALKMALDSLPKSTGRNLIHHSDRGMQYCCDAYVSILNEREITISMTERGDPYENALAERINRTLKEEFLLDKGFDSFTLAAAAVSKAVNTYNTRRPHDSCNGLTPNVAHQQSGILPKRWKKRAKARVNIYVNPDLSVPAGGCL
jgi:putative transposase